MNRIKEGFRSNASKAEVRSRLPKNNEKQDNDDWTKFEVLHITSITKHTLKRDTDRFNVPVENTDILRYQDRLE